MDALIALKLSRHVQFLAERAAKLGYDVARRLEQCRSR
jgi:hypothetical protein